MDAIEYELGKYNEEEEDIYDFQDISEIVEYIEYKMINQLSNEDEELFYEQIKKEKYEEIDLNLLEKIYYEIDHIKKCGYK